VAIDPNQCVSLNVEGNTRSDICVLQARADGGEQMRSAAETNSDPPGTGAVLVIADDILLRLVIADHLRSFGFTVWEVRSAEEALVVLKTVDGLGFVVTDVLMTGAALASWIGEERPHIEVISVIEATSKHFRQREKD
jgi:response regulator RpfG family c-di-GMP phosphodiesterase